MDLFFKVNFASKIQTKGMLYQKTQSISEDLGERQGRIESVKRGGSLVPWLPHRGVAPPLGTAGGALAFPPAL